MPSSSGRNGAMSTDITSTVKKLNHNASERDRRKKLNNLYSSLRSLLPGSDHTKKLSIPVTVSKVVKYIPDLQKQVDKLIQGKEEILTSISKQQTAGGGDRLRDSKSRKVLAVKKQSLPTVSANRVDDREVVIQICSLKVNIPLLSEVLLNLEREDFRVLNASAFDSSGDRVFYNLHLQLLS
ncbi:transcription factor ORG2-like isoform X2 [Papaver somniferum]|uniref:transcription factor ORG2-like isoform X2 n=1 Tax=Papaver somniferum TaxID=3469 RepID=UPI000E6F8989|nr:transcription factor ORG2-like isoform X2 [Papaver somniferum]